LPTQIGLRFFVDAFMQVGDLSAEDRASIDRQVRAVDRDNPDEN
jgi:heat-inducible transcriptional repressor